MDADYTALEKLDSNVVIDTRLSECMWEYRMRSIITRSWFETTLDYRLRILDPKIEEFPCLVHKLSVKLTALQ